MNLADQRSVKKQKRQADFERRRELDDLKAVASTEAGRRYLMKVLKKCGILALIFDATRPGMNDFYSGRRSIGIELLEEMNIADPDLFHQMSKEDRFEESKKPEAVSDADILYHPNTQINVPKHEEGEEEEND